MKGDEMSVTSSEQSKLECEEELLQNVTLF